MPRMSLGDTSVDLGQEAAATDAAAENPVQQQEASPIARGLKEAYEETAEEKGTKWSPRNVSQFIIRCRADCNGVPRFRPKFGGQLRVNGDPAVLLDCQYGTDGCPGQFFTNVPEKALETMSNRSGEWRFFLKKWEESGKLPKELVNRIGKALSAPTTVEI